MNTRRAGIQPYGLERCRLHGRRDGKLSWSPVVGSTSREVPNSRPYRIISLDGRPHVAGSVRSWSGDSTGHWEGDTLVVDTTNFKAQLHPLVVSEKFHLIERFTRIAPDEIRYEITFDDAETWVSPWSAVIRLKHTDDRLFESACHEGNEAIIKTILSGNLSK
jgi:hypothetical protein